MFKLEIPIRYLIYYRLKASWSRSWRPLKDFWIHKKVKSTIALVQKIKAKVENNKTISKTEKEYILTTFPEILNLAIEYDWCAGTGASQERRQLTRVIDELQEKTNKKLEKAGVTSERREFLEEIVFFSDIKYSELYGTNSFNRYYEELSSHSQFMQRIKKFT